MSYKHGYKEECRHKEDCADKDINPHIHSACGCAACSCTAHMLQEAEEEGRRADDGFHREIIFLAAAGAIFFAAFAAEELHLFRDERLHSLLHIIFAILYIATGWPVLKTACTALLSGDLFNEFTLMGGATLAAFAIGETCETVGVMLFYRIGEAFQERAASNSRRAIKALMARKPSVARVVEDCMVKETALQTLKKGDVVQVLPCEVIPIDGRVISGEARIDRSPITGETSPSAVRTGDGVLGGSVSLDGLLLSEATGTYNDSAAARMDETVRNAMKRKATAERFITRFAKWYTPAVFFLSAAVMLLPPLTGHGDWREWIYRGLVMLVISCPCALVISIPLGYFGGIGAASKRGILVKGADVFDALGKVKIAVFDKTGTLTYGRFKVSKVMPAEGVTSEELLQTAAMAECGSLHPFAKAVADAAGAKPTPKGAAITRFPGKGVTCSFKGDTIISGNETFLAEHGATFPRADGHDTVAYVMKNERFLGAIAAGDVLRPESAQAVRNLKKLGIKGVYMLTGDRRETAAQTAKELGLDGWRAELQPGSKDEALREICGGDAKKAVYVGDSVSDGPVLVASEAGIAMGGFGSRAAEAADAVILGDSPAKVTDLMRIAKKTRAIVWENVALALGVKGAFLALGASGHAGLWEAVFADVGVALLAILNATRAARLK